MRTKILSLALIALLLAGCGAIGGPTPTALPTVVLAGGGGSGTPQPTAQAHLPGGSVTASGHIQPAEQTTLAFAGAGRVISLTVAAGDSVQAGQVLAVLSGGDGLAAAVQSANLSVLNAQQALKDLQDSAQVATSQAQLAVAQAQAALTKAQKDLRNTQNPAGQSLQDAVDKARLALNTAQNNDQLATVSPDAQALVQATTQVNLTFSVYQNLQAKWDAGDHGDALYKALQAAHSAYQDALDKQTQLQLRIQTDKANLDQTVKDAQKDYNDAVNNQNAALKGPDADKLAVAQGNLAVATAALARAQAQYATVQAGPDPERLAADQQALATAQAQLAAARSALDDLVLKASIAGTVTTLNIHAGEWVLPGQPVLVLTDLAHLQVQTTDLSERDVPQVAVGQPVAVLVKALNQTLPGQVTEIALLADTLGGDVVYKTTIELTNRPSGLRAGMSVDVTFGVNP
jgi:multidrug efflux pump subunit AcrA (membrane-fusion protein)